MAFPFRDICMGYNETTKGLMMTVDIAYWTDVISENNEKIKPILAKLHNYPEKDLPREDLVLLRELLTNEAVYSNFLSGAVADQKSRSKKTWKFWK